MARTGNGRSKGCRTCVQRRVKCDERHPMCQRCEKGRFECEAYTKIHRFIDEVARTTRHAQKVSKASAIHSRDLVLSASGPHAVPPSLGLAGFEDNIFISFLLANLFAGMPVVSKPWMQTQAEDTTSMNMKEANEKFFAPRKLKVAIASRGAVGAVLCIPRDQPILAPVTEDTIGMGMIERSLAVMKGYAADLDFKVPPPAEQTTVLARMSARQIERQGKSSEQKMLKEREKALEKAEKKQTEMLRRQKKEKGRRGRVTESDSDREDNKERKGRRELKREQSRERKERRKEKMGDGDKAWEDEQG